MYGESESEPGRHVKYDLGTITSAYESQVINEVAVGMLGLMPTLSVEVSSSLTDAVPADEQPKITFKVLATRILMPATSEQVQYLSLNGDWTAQS
jgi:hypothetical protein